jgi:MFS family permease
MQTAMVYLLAMAFVAAIGAAQGAESDFLAFFTLRSFGLASFSTIVGVLAMRVMFGIALGTWLFGILFDRYGDYRIASLIGAVCFLGSSVFILAAGMAERIAVSKQPKPTAEQRAIAATGDVH